MWLPPEPHLYLSVAQCTLGHVGAVMGSLLQRINAQTLGGALQQQQRRRSTAIAKDDNGGIMTPNCPPQSGQRQSLSGSLAPPLGFG